MNKKQTTELASGDLHPVADRVWSMGQMAKMTLGIGLLAVVAGCVGVEGHGYVEGVYVVPPPVVVVREPDVYFYGGHEHGHYVHDYGHRGYESRQEVHPAIRLPPPPRLPTPSHPFPGLPRP